MRLTDERRWWLKCFGIGGWTMGRPMMVGIKKWDAHTAALVKMGLLEEDHPKSILYRITEAGRALLREEE